MSVEPTNLLQGTLDLLILKALGPGDLHGLGICIDVSRQITGNIPGKTRFSISRPSPYGGGRLAQFLLGRIGKQPAG